MMCAFTCALIRILAFLLDPAELLGRFSTMSGHLHPGIPCIIEWSDEEGMDHREWSEEDCALVESAEGVLMNSHDDP